MVIDENENLNDIYNQTINCVGFVKRLFEDPIRLLRAVRLSICLNFKLSNDILKWLDDPVYIDQIKSILKSKICNELNLCISKDPFQTICFFLSNHHSLFNILSSKCKLILTY
ncbi:MAG: hypothetical protein Satyrvirus5_19 [Satyrvirus sp.]|uniref:Uncharacterized protein n=1 Tax=Satyrvirus sp. TaxID=2487771 RepID=A0A3G5AEZ1_9VIRU|nr:MAG: hypothetical protein Satyrvirus5_19 [Satyrvirus sp.]